MIQMSFEDLSPPAAWPTLGPGAPASAPDIDHALSAIASLSTVLLNLIADADEALDYDREVARTRLQRAAALLQSGTARHGLTMRAPARAALVPWQATRVTSHIEVNLDRSLPLRELARVVRLSDSYFSRAFKGTFGQTPHAFILSRRVERARQEMLEGREPLSHIAQSCGFADQAHLARIFRRETGLTPSEWRSANGPTIDRARSVASCSLARLMSEETRADAGFPVSLESRLAYQAPGR
jgi:AraC-like DNA-binding protein